MDTAITTAPLKRSTLLLGVYASGDLAVVVIVGALAFLLVLLALNAMGTAGMPSLAGMGCLNSPVCCWRCSVGNGGVRCLRLWRRYGRRGRSAGRG